MKEMWKEIDRQIEEQKFEAAYEGAVEILRLAQSADNAEEWTRALIRCVQLRTGLHGYETAVRFLADEPWPEDSIQRAALHLYYAGSLRNYFQMYSWEIQQREKVVSDDEVDLKQWTRDQLFSAAQESFHSAWALRDSWGTSDLGPIAEYVVPNNYPKEVRGTLRDAVTYLWVDFLADTQWWSPSESNDLFGLDRDQLLGGDAKSLSAVVPGQTGDHPLLQIAVLMADLETWHRRGKRPEAAFEARRVRLERLHASLTGTKDRTILREELQKALDRLGDDHEWWSLGMATLAEMVKQSGDPNAFVEAHDIAHRGQLRHPKSVGGQRCLHIVASIETPSYQVQSMTLDGRDRRSIQVTHQNLPRLYFRAYTLDVKARLGRAKDYNLLPQHQEIADLVKNSQIAAQWSVDLPATPDYRSHQTFVTPKLEEPGMYVIVSSARADFSEVQNQLYAVNLLMSDLVLLSRQEGLTLEVEARSGKTGFPLAEAEVVLYRFDWQKGHRPVARGTSDLEGRLEFKLSTEGSQFFLYGTHGDQISLDANYFYPQNVPENGVRTAALLFTDRSVYRPHQTIHWKVVPYRGGGSESRFETLAGQSVTVTLVDANGEEVTQEKVTTNEFGTSSGEFVIPAGRLLGSWTVRSSLQGSTSVRVEEYKRPTFEVTLDDPKNPLRLNQPAELTGEARYYFGLPLGGGEARWQVTRESLYPWWWYWRPPVPSQTIAAGSSVIDEEGKFTVTFTPEAEDLGEESAGVTYRYRLSAEVTDEGGETRSTDRSFRLGFVGIEASISTVDSFFMAGEGGTVSIRRTDLDGQARPGIGTWQLLRLQQPKRSSMPADLPVVGAKDGFQTEGDRHPARWQTNYSPEALMATWKTEDEPLASGSVEHGAEGNATVSVPADLPAGAYRLIYTTEDASGQSAIARRDLLIVSPEMNDLALPALLLTQRSSVEVGERARVLVYSGFRHQEIVVESFRRGQRVRRRVLPAGLHLLDLPMDREDRGGYGFTLSLLRDHQLLSLTRSVFVPWTDRELQLEFSTFRDRLRPGTDEKWSVVVRGSDDEVVSRGSAEVLAYMYDRSLDLFAPHSPASPLALYPNFSGQRVARANLGTAGTVWWAGSGLSNVPGYPYLQENALQFHSGYAIGGMGSRRRMQSLGYADGLERRANAPMPSSAPMVQESVAMDSVMAKKKEGLVAELESKEDDAQASQPPAAEVRSNFAETAFWEPHLLTDADGTVRFEFTVPDSVTEWNVWVHGLTRDLRGGSTRVNTKTIKELLVRPYVPRFLREGDQANLRVQVDNAGESTLTGTLDFEIFDPAQGDATAGPDLLAAFGLTPEDVTDVPFELEPGGHATLTFPLAVPSRVGPVAFRVVGRAGEFSDGELRALPVLPSRMHLVQSRFTTLHDEDSKRLVFEDLQADDDPSLINDQLVVTIDGQLFYQVLDALPYLVDYPYECTEQTLNRFLSSGIVTSVFDEYPSIAKMAKEMSQRDTPLAEWNAEDPNRQMALVETPWLRQSRGGESDHDLIKVLDPRIAEATRRDALDKLRKSQTSLGAFPWWSGGPPSPYMTLYLLHGFSRALEFDVEVPKDMVQQAWGYMHRHYIEELVATMMERDCCWETITFLNYVLSSYPDESWSQGVFTAEERQQMLDFSFSHWKQHSPLLKGMLTLTLERSDRHADAVLVFDSVMDSAKTTEEDGTFWAPEDRAWLWYNDTIESHAFALRVLEELDPDDSRRHGLVQWLLINKKLGHWKSTRATAEVIYSLVHYLEQDGSLGVRESVDVQVADQHREFVFEPEEYTGKNNQWLIPGDEVTPAMGAIEVSKETPGFLFASATWHFSTEELPEEASGDLFHVERTYFRRVHSGEEWTLEPLTDRTRLTPGDQVEVHLSIRSRHAAEYVHLRDPRGAGFEPETLQSGYRYDLGIGRYEEVRDSGTNFFFEWLPAGEYTMKYRLRANMEGTFRVGPATLQSMYAPEFAAYSSGKVLSVVEAAK
ncbi:MAG: hypothetical protein K8J08_14725 [Thermoanaerobaculia bacterium]|nr:hypothetical protein [Thermoanaerobaculia bacterium]